MRVNRHNFRVYKDGPLALKEVRPGFFEFEPGDMTHYRFHRIAEPGYLFSVGRDFAIGVAIITDDNYLRWIKPRQGPAMDYDEMIAMFGFELIKGNEVEPPERFR